MADRLELDAPFPWFGGKRRVSPAVWDRFGTVTNFVEPFFGSGAVLLGRPRPVTGVETVNDLDGYVANFWRALRAEPDAVAAHADHPVFEVDLHARHVWLVSQRETLRAQLEGDPEWYDTQVAGWWAWGISCWIGGGFCSGAGPWWPDDTGQLVRRIDGGRGVDRKRVHLGDGGRGVNRQRVHLGDGGQGPGSPSRLIPWFRALAERLRGVRVCSGDWTRVCGPVTVGHGLTGVFFDPPYSDAAGRDPDLYRVDDLHVAHAVREWCIAHGDHPLLRIALCGYEGEHEMPASWSRHRWHAGAGYGGMRHPARARSENGARETIWFSPSCLAARQSCFLFAADG